MSPVKLGLKCHPAQVPTSWKPFCKCIISSFPEHSPRNINLSPVWWHKSFQVIWIQVIWIQVIPETLPHDRESSLPPACLLTGCSMLTCASKSRVPDLNLPLEFFLALGFTCLVLILPLHRCLAICTFPWWGKALGQMHGKGGFKKALQ